MLANDEIRRTNDASRTTDEEGGLFEYPVESFPLFSDVQNIEVLL